eukprot:gene16875-2416_t
MFVVLLVVLGIVHRASGLEDGFVHEKMLAVQHSKGALMQMVFLPSDDRAFILDKNGYIYITEPEKQGFPMEVYMYLPSTYSKEEVGLISILPSQEWAAGDKTFYLYWGHKDRNTAGMRISKFSHSENDGGLSSRGIASSET